MITLSATEPIARKPHVCNWCGQDILIGEKYSRWTGTYMDDFQSNPMHAECNEVAAVSDDDGYDVGENARGSTGEKPVNENADARARQLIPENIVNAMIAYRDSAFPTGDFVQAVIENDLVGAIKHADYMSSMAMEHIVDFIVATFPRACWGSPKAYANWIETRFDGTYGGAMQRSMPPFTTADSLEIARKRAGKP